MTDYQNPEILLSFETSGHRISADPDEPGIHIGAINSDNEIYIEEDELYNFLSAYQMALVEVEKIQARRDDEEASDDEG